MKFNEIRIGDLVIPWRDLSIKGIRSGGPGGQHVNKVSTGVRLRFDILHSSISDEHKVRLIQSGDRRISKKGVLTIEASSRRSRVDNMKLAVQGLIVFIQKQLKSKKKRIPTKLSKAAKEKRRKDKKFRSEKKANRKKVKL